VRRAVVVVAAVAVFVAGLASCLTGYNRPKVTLLDGAPAVAPRPGGCNVEIVEDGKQVGRPSAPIGHIVLDWPNDKVKEQGPDGAIKTLREAACEAGAFFVLNMRGLPTADGGLVYEADLATLVGDDGKPINAAEKKVVSAPSPPPRSGW
jgi:hypothetical protein